MDENGLLKWVETVISGLPKFLESMKDNNTPGRYKYSLSGDMVFDKKWGLANTVFAVKTYYMLNRLDDSEKKEMASFIKFFTSPNGEISDPIVQKKSRKNRLIVSLRSGDWNNVLGKQNRRAETRQSFAALRALGEKPNRPYLNIPQTKRKIKRYIHSLDWNHPWGAGSHFSHLIFFLKNNGEMFKYHNYDELELIDFAFKEVNRYRQTDGAWYNRSASDAQKVNGAMKMVTAYMASERKELNNRKKLIDLCLALKSNPDACNNFNLVLVLYFCSQNSNYRKSEIKDFILDRLQIYKSYYWPEKGGFSFFEKKANKNYYDAKISEGLAEPDIHGTHLFLWGITLISKILKLEDSIQLNMPIS